MWQVLSCGGCWLYFRLLLPLGSMPHIPSLVAWCLLRVPQYDFGWHHCCSCSSCSTGRVTAEFRVSLVSSLFIDLSLTLRCTHMGISPYACQSVCTEPEVGLVSVIPRHALYNSGSIILAWLDSTQSVMKCSVVE